MPTISPISEATFPCRVPFFPGKMRVEIRSFGKRMDGTDGCQGSITDEYTHAELWTFTQNTLKHTGYDQPTGLRFSFPGTDRPYAYITLPWRLSHVG